MKFYVHRKVGMSGTFPVFRIDGGLFFSQKGDISSTYPIPVQYNSCSTYPIPVQYNSCMNDTVQQTYLSILKLHFV